MSKFERIVREPLVMGGQARIRDTGITVNEIVRLSLDGASQAEILQQFPQLEADDVHEALGYTLDDTLHNIAVNHSSILEAIASIIGYGEILLGRIQFNSITGASQEESIAEFKQKFLEIMLFNGQRAKVQTKVLDAWRRANLRGFEDPFYENLQYVLSEAVKEAREFSYDLIVDTNILLDKQSSLVDTNIITVLSYTLAGVYDVTPDAHLLITSGDKLLHFTIKRELQQHIKVYQIQRQTSLVQIATLLLYRLGSELKIRQEGNSVIFEFALPIVEAE